jgi:hypothetical protein
MILAPNPGDWQQEKATLMLLGYARVSRSDDQETAPQIRALKEAGCKKVFEETASGGKVGSTRAASAARPAPPQPRLTCVEDNTVRQIKSKLIHMSAS